jgi:type IV pilus assembly protein PilE
MESQQAARSSGGFTLIELMVVVVIASILISIAVPSYMTQIRQSRRTEAKTAVLDAAGREERFFSTNASTYTATAANLGYNGLGAANPVGSGYYYLLVCSPANSNCAPGLNMPNPPAAPSYTIVAVAAAGQSQVNDTQCGMFAVDSIGQQYAVTTAAAQNTAYCWAN